MNREQDRQRKGLFETIRVRRGRPVRLSLHAQRLQRSWPAFFAGSPPSLDALAETALAQQPDADGLLKLAFHPDGTHGFVVEQSIRECRPFHTPVRASLASQPRWTRAVQRVHKTTDRRWVDAVDVKPGEEVLVWNRDSGLLEGTRTNVFVLLKGHWVTPSSGLGLVPGVVRELILRQNQGFFAIPVQQARISLERIPGCGGLVLTGSGVGAVPVARLGEKDLPMDAAGSFCEEIGRTLTEDSSG